MYLVVSLVALLVAAVALLVAMVGSFADYMRPDPFGRHPVRAVLVKMNRPRRAVRS